MTEKNFTDNCFDLLRIIAAVMVMLSHSFRHFNIVKPKWLFFLCDGSIGVIIFFTISGFLVMSSYERCLFKGESVWHFWWKRIIRIYPGFLLCFLFVSILNLMEGINIFQISYFKYFATDWLYPRGGAFGNGYSNGVFWTLKCELIFYFLVPFIYKCMKKMSMIKNICLIVAFWIFACFDAQIIEMMHQYRYIRLFFKDSSIEFFMYEFLLGSFFYFYRNKFLCSLPSKRMLFSYGTLWFIWYCINRYINILPRIGMMHNVFVSIATPSLVIGMAYGFGKIRFNYDISYGIFLYHMPIIYVFLKMGFDNISGMICVWPVVILMAFCSTILEKKAIKYLA